jgi:hypothetical protein
MISSVAPWTAARSRTTRDEPPAAASRGAEGALSYFVFLDPRRSVRASRIRHRCADSRSESVQEPARASSARTLVFLRRPRTLGNWCRRAIRIDPASTRIPSSTRIAGSARRASALSELVSTVRLGLAFMVPGGTVPVPELTECGDSTRAMRCDHRRQSEAGRARLPDAAMRLANALVIPGDGK